VAVEILRAAIADGARVVVEDRAEIGDVVSNQRLLVAYKRRLHLGDDVGQVDLHQAVPISNCGRGAAATPMFSSAWATRSATSSRQGAAMIWMPIGSGSRGIGTAATGRPMNEIG